jgi:hypothetical protein
MLQATLKDVVSAALADGVASNATPARTARNRIWRKRRTAGIEEDDAEVWIRGMRVSRVVSASGISRAFVPPCIPGASRTTGLRLSDQR